MQYFALFYEVVDEFINRRTPYRNEHLRLAGEAHARGEIVLAGALADPADQALLIFRAESAALVEDFARSDPYVKSGLVVRWQVRPWTVVVGNEPVQKRDALGGVTHDWANLVRANKRASI